MRSVFSVRPTLLALSGVALAVGLAVPAGAAPAAAACPLPRFRPGASYHPVVDPAAFGPDVDNAWFPLTPGVVDVYAGTKDGKHALNVVAPSSRTRVVDGVTTRVVEDRLYLDGVLEERTADYYAQDRCGNVWYFGEDTATIDRHGKVRSREGSFHAGVRGAQPGVFMEAEPELGRAFRQEWDPGDAEDQFVAVDRSAALTLPAHAYANLLRTREVTDLEPGVVDNKYYARGIGEIVETSVKGPKERLGLVETIDLRP
jgi:hypothetical protein